MITRILCWFDYDYNRCFGTQDKAISAQCLPTDTKRLDLLISSDCLHSAHVQVASFQLTFFQSVQGFRFNNYRKNNKRFQYIATPLLKYTLLSSIQCLLQRIIRLFLSYNFKYLIDGNHKMYGSESLNVNKQIRKIIMKNRCHCS